MRHGKAAPPENYDNDFDRPLNKKGIAQINQIGYRMKADGIEIDQLISSAAKRTKQTTAIANYFMGVKSPTFDRSLYLVDVQHIIDFINKNGNGKRLLYVGHNFGITDAASRLSGQKINMSTGMLVHLRFEFDDWKMLSQNTGELINTYVPEIYVP